MQEFSVIDEIFDHTLSSSYFLSIQFSLDGFSFCTLDPIQNLFIQFKNYEFDKSDKDYIKSINLFQSEPLLNYQYKKTFILFQTDKCTLVPSSIFNKESVKDVLRFTFDDPFMNGENDPFIIHNKIKMADAYNVFSARQELLRILKQRYSNVTFLHSTTPFIEANLLEDQRRYGEQQNHIHLSFTKNHFNVIVVENRELKLSNCFTFRSNQDIIYYLFYIFDQLKLNIDKTDITIAGEIIENRTQLSFVKKYIPKLITEKPEKHFNFSPVFKTVNISRFNNLFNAPICV